MNFTENEKKILEFWEKNKIFKKLQKKIRGKTPWSFFDGPITANNPMGVHHAWGRTLKDFYQRYKAMQGFDQRFQNGFDCQGLWVEVEVEKDLGFNSKRDIEKFGLAKFSKACSDRVKKFSKQITEQSKRLGQWMDWENSYFTMSETNNLHIWQFLKKCHENGWIRKGTDVVPWCFRCGTAISQHELSDGGYADLKHKAIYVVFPLLQSPLYQGRKGEVESLLVWTTTPWTLLANVACAVDPDLDYVKIKPNVILERGREAAEAIESSAPTSVSGLHDDMVVWLAKSRVKEIFGKDIKILETKKGKDFVGLEYQGPFDDLPSSKVEHRVVAWDEVLSEEGTCIVHIATGCGKEDHALGQKERLEVIDPIEEDGSYKEGFGEFTGKKAQDMGGKVIENLEKKNLLVKEEEITHSYPICWRCKEELLFRVSTEWFIKADEIRPKMKKRAKSAKWIPKFAGKRMQDWLDNMGDWPISRKRFWGLALPFYECKCGQLTVVGSKKELKELAVNPKLADKLASLHRPWVDEIKIKCPKCKKETERIPDVGDCWLDAGIIPFSTLKYPTPDDKGDKEYWKKWFPAELVCESIPQVKLWFYSLLFMSVALEDTIPYKDVLTYASVVDEAGRPMHKSTGNAIWFDEAIEKMGADVMRWVYLRGGIEDNLRFGFNIGEEMRKKLLILWNVVSFYKLFAEGGDSSSRVTRYTLLDRWILARLHQVIQSTTASIEKYETAKAVKDLESFIEDLSTWYVRRSRERVKNEDNTPILVLREALETLSRLLAPFIPFLSESIYKELDIDTRCSSVHLQDWPKFDKKKINKKTLDDVAAVRKICETAHSIRADAGIRVRQPLALLTYQGVKLTKEHENLIADELNVLKVNRAPGETGNIKVKLELKITPELKRAGLARELIRAVNQFRKELGLKAGQEVKLEVETASEEIRSMLEKFDGEIYKSTHCVRGALPVGEDKKVNIDGEVVIIKIKK